MLLNTVQMNAKPWELSISALRTSHLTTLLSLVVPYLLWPIAPSLSDAVFGPHIVVILSQTVHYGFLGSCQDDIWQIDRSRTVPIPQLIPVWQIKRLTFPCAFLPSRPHRDKLAFENQLVDILVGESDIFDLLISMVIWQPNMDTKSQECPSRHTVLKYKWSHCCRSYKQFSSLSSILLMLLLYKSVIVYK